MRPRRPARLKELTYVGRIGYSLRFATNYRAPYFTNPVLIAEALKQIQLTCDEDRFALIAYCFMPDHVHLAVRGRTTESDLKRFARLAKQRIAYLARTQFGIPMIWQSGYYERIVRAQAMEGLVRYILNNPVQAGLVTRAEEYPFSGVDTRA